MLSDVKLKSGDLVSWRVSAGIDMPHRAIYFLGFRVESIDVTADSQIFTIISIEEESPGLCLKLFCPKTACVIMMWYGEAQAVKMHECWNVHCTLG